MMRVIFLDIDGVLNSQQYFIESNDKVKEFNKHYQDNMEFIVKRKMFDIDLDKLAILKDITIISHAVVVIISSWKRLNVYPFIKKELVKYGIPIIGETIDNSDNRGLGIRNYLRENNIREYIILDDDIFPDYDEELQKHLVKTNFYQDGLNEELSQIAIKKLQKKENKL